MIFSCIISGYQVHIDSDKNPPNGGFFVAFGCFYLLNLGGRDDDTSLKLCGAGKFFDLR